MSTTTNTPPNSGGGAGEDPTPYHLMPLAAIFATYAIAASIHALHRILSTLSSSSTNPKSSSTTTTPRNVLRPHAPPTAKPPSAISKLPSLLFSPSFLLLLTSIITSTVLYGMTTARVNASLPLDEPFDPYKILGLDYGTVDVTEIKTAYRSMAKMYHPDKHSGEDTMFQEVNLAYRALTEEEAKENWEMFGHPDGMKGRPVMEFAIPDWLLRPKGNVALVMVGLYVAFFFGLVLWLVLRKLPSSSSSSSPTAASTTTAENSTDKTTQKDKTNDSLFGRSGPRTDLQDNTVSAEDIAYLANNLRPDSTPLQILLYLGTTPESLRLTAAHLRIADTMKEKRIAHLQKKQNAKQEEEEKEEEERRRAEAEAAAAEAAAAKKKEEEDEFGLSSGGWADSDEDSDDEDVQAARRAQREKDLLATQVAEASGRAVPTKKLDSEEDVMEKMRIEGVDEGVLGQCWVEKTLEGIGQWPPVLLREGGGMEGMSVKGEGEGGGEVGVLECREARRNLCMILGRLNAQTLNTHPELVAAGQNELIDLTYFKATMEFRQRTGILLEAALRVAGMTRSYRLYRTVVETAAMFKIGATSATSKKTIRWFETAMTKTYGDEDGIPKVELGGKILRKYVKGEEEGGEGGNDTEEKEEEEIRGGDPLVLEIEVDRLHAEKFLKHKMNMAMKQGIDPKMVLGMGAYRELWWILVRAKRVSDADDVDNDNIEINDSDDAGAEDKLINEESRKIFSAERDENRLLTAWPLIVQSIAQKKGNVKVKFQAPSRPGKYEFLVDVKSQEFFGCDQSFTVEKEVVDRKEEDE